MCQGSGRCAGDCVGEASGTTLGGNYAVSSSGKRGPHNGAEVVRIFYSIEENNETDLTFRLIGAGENIFDSGGGAHGGDGDYTLMFASVGESIKLAAIFKADRNAAFARELDDFFDAGVLATFGDDDAVEGAACFESFANRVNAGEPIH